MVSKNLLYILLIAIVVLSCKKTDTKIEQLDFETVLKSNVWFVSLNAEAIGTQNADSIEYYPNVNYTNACDSNTLFTFNADSTYTKYINSNGNIGCNAFIKDVNIWQYSADENFLRFRYRENGRIITSIGFIVRSYSENEIQLFSGPIIGFDEPYPENTYSIVKLQAK